MERKDRSESSPRPYASIGLLPFALMVVMAALAPAAIATTHEEKQNADDGPSSGHSEEYVLGNGNLLIQQDGGLQGMPGIGGVFFAHAVPSDSFSVIDDVHGQIGYDYEWNHRGVWIWIGAGAVSGTVTWTPDGDQ